jgi:hypothetical protein
MLTLNALRRGCQAELCKSAGAGGVAVAAPVGSGWISIRASPTDSLILQRIEQGELVLAAPEWLVQGLTPPQHENILPGTANEVTQFDLGNERMALACGNPGT